MIYPVVVLKVTSTQFSALVSLANRVCTSLTGNLSFAEPAIPLATLASATVAVEDAIAAWGTKNDRGSHATYVDLKTKAITLHNMLKAEADYVQTTASIAAGSDYAMMTAIISTSGFAVKSIPSHQGVLNVVQNLRFMASGSLNRNQVKVVWDKPLGVTSRNNVGSYNVYRSTTAIFDDAVLIDTVMQTEFIDTNATSSPVTWYYFVCAIGTAGQGAVSNAVVVSLIA